MKKRAGLIFAVLAALLLGGCGAGMPGDISVPQETALAQIDPVQTPVCVPGTTEEAKTEPVFLLEPFPEDEDHIDLSANGSVAAFARISEIALSPREYEGKTFRLQGTYAESTDDDGNAYLCCLVFDLNGCCMQGLNFIPAAEEEDTAADLSEGEKIVIEGVYVKTGRGYCVTDAHIYRAE